MAELSTWSARQQWLLRPSKTSKSTTLSQSLLTWEQPEFCSATRGLRWVVWIPFLHANLIPGLFFSALKLIIKKKEQICSPEVFAALLLSLWVEYIFACSVEEIIWTDESLLQSWNVLDTWRCLCQRFFLRKYSALGRTAVPELFFHLTYGNNSLCFFTKNYWSSSIAWRDTVRAM